MLRNLMMLLDTSPHPCAYYEQINMTYVPQALNLEQVLRLFLRRVV